MTVKKNDISFEEALKDLEKIVENLNNGDMELEKAITAYEKGIQLKKFPRCAGHLLKKSYEKKGILAKQELACNSLSVYD